jgi:hypothetical protein
MWRKSSPPERSSPAARCARRWRANFIPTSHSRCRCGLWGSGGSIGGVFDERRSVGDRSRIGRIGRRNDGVAVIPVVAWRTCDHAVGGKVDGGGRRDTLPATNGAKRSAEMYAHYMTRKRMFALRS